MQTPVFLFAFANDDAQRLGLDEEWKKAEKALQQRVDDGNLVFNPTSSSNKEDLFDKFQRFHGRITLFHYGGHSGAGELILKGSPLQADTLATLLGQEKQLQLAFLNGCSNAAQVAQLFAQGVPAVIATTALIQDRRAVDLSRTFYEGLSRGRSIGDAFALAAAFVNNEENQTFIPPRGIDALPAADEAFPWGLYVQDESVLQWKIPSAAPVPAQPDRQENLFYGDKKIPRYLTAPPFLAPVFLGRESDLQQIRQKLLGQTQLLLLVNGRGGVGKTTLAARYFHQFGSAYQHLAWVLSENNLTQALLSLARPLHLEFDDRMPNAERLPLLLAALAELQGPCLLVIDNANDLADLEAHYLALQGLPNFHLLLTSRITSFEQAEAFAIAGLPPAEALSLFKTYYPLHRETEDELFFALHQAVWGNTLVIELLAKNLARFNNRLKQRYALSDLIRDLNEKGLLALQGKEVTAHYQARGTQLRKEKPEDILAAMYELSELSEDEKRILSVFAVLPPENIPFAVLEDLLLDEAELDQQLLALAQKGWLEMLETDFKVSPVVQEITRRKNPDLRQDCQGLIEGLNRKLAYEPITGHFKNSTYQEATLFAIFAESTGIAFPQADIDLAVLFDRIGRYHQTTGNLDQALLYFHKSQLQRKERYESDLDNVEYKNDLTIAYERLGSIQNALGNLQKAHAYFEQYQQLKKELYDADPQNETFINGLAISHSKLGTLQTVLGNLDQALFYFEQFHELADELYKLDPRNASFKHNLAISYLKLGATQSSLGNMEKAFPYFEQFQRLEQELWESDPHNVNYKNGLAVAYEKLGTTQHALGNPDKALDYFEQSHQLEKALYAAYPQNVAFKNNLAISFSKLGEVQRSLGNPDKALPFFERYSHLRKELYEAFPQNVSFKNGLAVSYLQLGDCHVGQGNTTSQARSFFQQAEQLLVELIVASPQHEKFGHNLEVVRKRLADLGG